jgi:hypothetical protein
MKHSYTKEADILCLGGAVQRKKGYAKCGSQKETKIYVS